MAEINVEVVNGSGQTVGLRLEENGETHEYLKTLVRRGDLESVDKAGARRSASKTATKSAADEKK